MEVLPANVRQRISHDGDGCWPWIGPTDRDGYGIHCHKQAHRVVYTYLRGPIPTGLSIDHLCKTRNCVNPRHLEAVPIRVNILRGDGPAAQNARKTHCKNGHEFTDTNTRRHGGRRYCRTCESIKNSRYYQARKARTAK